MGRLGETMKVEMKIKIGKNEVTMEQAKIIYEALKEIFDNKANSSKSFKINYIPLPSPFTRMNPPNTGTPLPQSPIFVS